MISIVSGLVAVGAGGVGLWYVMPNGEVLHPHANKPILDSAVPICIVAAFALGLALIISGIGIN